MFTLKEPHDPSAHSPPPGAVVSPRKPCVSPKGFSSTDMGAMVLSLCPTTGFMTQDERKKFESLHSDFNKYWIPCVWFTNLAAQARRDGRICDDVALRLLMDVSWRWVLRGDQALRGALRKAGVTHPCPLCPGAEPLPGQVQHVVPLRLDQHPPGVHTGGYPRTLWAPHAQIPVPSTLQWQRSPTASSPHPDGEHLTPLPKNTLVPIESGAESSTAAG